MSVRICSVVGQVECVVVARSFSILFLILCVFWALNSYALYYLLITNVLSMLNLKLLVYVIQART